VTCESTQELLRPWVRPQGRNVRHGVWSRQMRCNNDTNVGEVGRSAQVSRAFRIAPASLRAYLVVCITLFKIWLCRFSKNQTKFAGIHKIYVYSTYIFQNQLEIHLKNKKIKPNHNSATRKQEQKWHYSHSNLYFFISLSVFEFGSEILGNINTLLVNTHKFVPKNLALVNLNFEKC
jgi:hypothetical protein